MFDIDFGEGMGKIVDFKAGLSLIPGACIFMPLRGPGEWTKERLCNALGSV